MYSPFEPTKIVSFLVLDNALYILNSFLTTNASHLLSICSIIFMISVYMCNWTVYSNFFFFLFNLFNFVYETVYSYLDEELSNELFPFFMYLFSFIFISNIIGLLPYEFAITSHLSSTLSCSLFVWTSVIFLGFSINGFSFVNIMVPKGIPNLLVPFLILIEFISYLFRAVSLALRLFANILAGHILLHVVSSFISLALTSFVTGFFISKSIIGILMVFILVILLFFELMVACLQSYIFLVLSLIYITDLVNLNH